MEIVVRPRQAGKTQEAVAWLKAGEKISRWPFWTRVLLVPLDSEAKRYQTAYELDRFQVFSFERWREQAQTASSDTTLAIDNADDILRRLVHSPVALATFTEEISHE